MDSTLIDIYGTAFIICIVLTAVFLLLSVFLFIKFDIWTQIAMLTGRAEKVSIKNIEKENALHSSKLKKENPVVHKATIDKKAVDLNAMTTPLSMTDNTPMMTTPLKVASPRKVSGSFVITEDITVVHTNDII